jgi:uncharacterized membrane protein
MAKKKFDTNPLDPEFPKKAAAEPAPQTQALPTNGAGAATTRKFEEAAETEDQTRRFEDGNFNQYQSPYNGQNVPTGYQPANFYVKPEPRNRKVAKIGLPENILTALPYIPFFIGLVAGLVELFFVPKSEAKVRFHAAQGVAAHIGILIVSAILGGIGNITDLGDVGNWVFKTVTTVMLIVFAIKAWQGKPIHIESVDELTNWLEDKIKPSE